MQEGRRKHYATKAMLDELIGSVQGGADHIVMSIPNYVAYRMLHLTASPALHTLHKAVWDAGYKVNGFHPDKMGNLTTQPRFGNMTAII